MSQTLTVYTVHQHYRSDKWRAKCTCGWYSDHHTMFYDCAQEALDHRNRAHATEEVYGAKGGLIPARSATL